MKLSAKTKIDELLKENAFLEDFLVKYNPKFEMLRSKVARATVGKVANLKSAAAVGGVALADLLRDIAKEIERVTGEAPETDAEEGRQQRVEGLKEVIRALHDGASVDDVRQRFAEVIAGADGPEIAAMEQQLIQEGLPVEEVQRLCDVHVGAFRESLDAQAEAEAPPGHPVNTYMRANEKIAELANELAETARKLGDSANEARRDALARARKIVEELGGIDLHYLRKENQLFPFLEKHGIEGPSKVMWAVHDEIRGRLRKAREAAKKEDIKELISEAPKLARDLAEMIYKENKILFPMALEELTPDDWSQVRRGEDELGYAFAEPAESAEGTTAETVSAERAAGGGEGPIPLETGGLTVEQINLILRHLPVDISFVDENDEVRYYSEGERHFPRSPAVIGRTVQNCHPQKSVHMVQGILDAFRAGKKDTAEFWIEHGGRFLLIRYFALRDKDGNYKGCLEAGEDITEARKLEGEKRLLDWEE